MKGGRKDEPAEGNPTGRGTPGEGSGSGEGDENYIDSLISSGEEEATTLLWRHMIDRVLGGYRMTLRRPTCPI